MTPWWFIVALLSGLGALALYCVAAYKRKANEIDLAIAAHLDHECSPGCVMCEFDAARARRADS